MIIDLIAVLNKHKRKSIALKMIIFAQKKLLKKKILFKQAQYPAIMHQLNFIKKLVLNYHLKDLYIIIIQIK